VLHANVWSVVAQLISTLIGLSYSAVSISLWHSMRSQSLINTVVLTVDSGSGESATTRSGHYNDLPYDEVWYIHICRSTYSAGTL